METEIKLTVKYKLKYRVPYFFVITVDSCTGVFVAAVKLSALTYSQNRRLQGVWERNRNKTHL